MTSSIKRVALGSLTSLLTIDPFFYCPAELFFGARAIMMLFADAKFAEDTVQQIFTGGLACDFAQGIIGRP